jgi:hypothetical protein
VVQKFESCKQEVKVAGSNPTATTKPEKGALRILLGLCDPFALSDPDLLFVVTVTL